MIYQEILTHIYGLARFGMKPGLQRISLLLNALDNPHQGLEVVHVAGTNGKGSTAAFLSSIFVAGGYKVGLFTSPHLISFTERIRVNGAEIAEDVVVRLAERVLNAAAEGTTFFEIVTAIALLHFAEEGVDLAVLEAGMGGGLDATAVASGLLSVITPISLDHCEWLGETLRDIASEKVGVAKPGCPLVLSSQPASVLDVVEPKATAQGSPLFISGRDFSALWNDSGLAYRGLNISLSGLRPGIGGRYQAENAASALCSAELLTTRGFPLDITHFRQGIETARWPGRMELFPGPPRILLDGAHNSAGVAALIESLADIPRTRLLLVTGVMADKDVEGIIGPLLPLAAEVFAVSAGMERAMPGDIISSLCRRQGATCVDAGGVEAGLSMAGDAAGPDDLILVCGSLFVVGEARAHLLSRRFEPFRG